MNVNLCLKHGFSLNAIFNATIAVCFNSFSKRNQAIFETDWFHQLKRLVELGHEEAQWLYGIFLQNPHPKDVFCTILSSETSVRSFYYASRFAYDLNLERMCLHFSAQREYPRAILPNAIRSGTVGKLIQRIDTLTISASNMYILYAHSFPEDKPVIGFLKQRAAENGFQTAMIRLASDAFVRKQYDQCMQWAFNAAIFGYPDVISTISNVLSEGHKYLVGKYMWLGMKDTYFFANVLDTIEKVGLEQAEFRFIAQKTAAQRSVFTWMWISRRWGIPRDVALIIARITWAARNAPLH